MYPMDFEEFIWAQGEDVLWDYIKDCYNKKRERNSITMPTIIMNQNATILRLTFFYPMKAS